MLAKLDQVSRLAEEGKCETAASIAREVEDQIDALPPSIDPQLRVALEDGVNRLITLTGDPVTCTGEETQTVPTVTQTQTIPPTTSIETPPDGGGGVGPGANGGSGP